MLKAHTSLSPDILRAIFVPKRSSYNLCMNKGSLCEPLSLLGPTIWDLVPLELKQLECLGIFKFKINKWIPFESSEIAILTGKKITD